MAKAATTTIAEVEEIVDVGEIDPDQVHIPGIFVDRIIRGDSFEKRVEVRDDFQFENDYFLEVLHFRDWKQQITTSPTMK